MSVSDATWISLGNGVYIHLVAGGYIEICNPVTVPRWHDAPELGAVLKVPAPPALHTWAERILAAALRDLSCSGCYEQNIRGYQSMATLASDDKREDYLARADFLKLCSTLTGCRRAQKDANAAAERAALCAAAAPCADPYDLVNKFLLRRTFPSREEPVAGVAGVAGSSRDCRSTDDGIRTCALTERIEEALMVLHQLRWLFAEILRQAASAGAACALDKILAIAAHVASADPSLNHFVHEMREQLPAGAAGGAAPLLTVEDLLRTVDPARAAELFPRWADRRQLPWTTLFAEFIRPPPTAAQVRADTAVHAATAAARAWILTSVPAAQGADVLYA